MANVRVQLTEGHLPSRELNFLGIAPSQALRSSLPEPLYEFMPFCSEAHQRLPGLFPITQTTDYPASSEPQYPTAKDDPFLAQMARASRLQKKAHRKKSTPSPGS